jgi:NAD(P)-dependent dehydrogenase (short-subunit alcohol dehydrogenase family)
MMDDSYWQGRVAVITGATHGIGLRLAERLADKGVRIATIYHNNDAQAIALRKTIEDRGSEYMIAKGDIAEKANIKELTDAADRRWGRIDFLINNIGVDISGPIAELKIGRAHV